ncbi:hypothetical protein RZE82_06505 [Mollicutes bacterium LVI A0039]|nr:hypothetical protein RZE82_06505 [Mollicutes bacterium LVI A0039]
MKKKVMIAAGTITIMCIICFSIYCIKEIMIYRNDNPCIEMTNYTIGELYENYSNGLSEHFFNPQNVYKIKPTYDTRDININSREGIIKFAYTKEIQEIKYGGTCIGNEKNTDLTQIDYKNYIITNYEGITKLNIDEQIDKLKEFFLNIDVILNDFGNYISSGRYDGEGDSIEELDLFLNQYVDLSRIERELLHDVISLYIKSKEVEIFNEYFNDNTNLSALWREYAHLKGVDELLGDIDNILLDNSDDIEKLNTEDFDIVISDNYIEVVDNKKESKFIINDISVPPLTFVETEWDEALESSKRSIFEFVVSKFEYRSDKKNQLSLYNLIMIEELVEQYDYESTNKICSPTDEKKKCVKEDIDIILNEKSTDKMKIDALTNLAYWEEAKGNSIERRLGYTYEISNINNLNNTMGTTLIFLDN